MGGKSGAGCSLIHICQGLGLTDEGSSSLISPLVWVEYYRMGCEVCFLKTHTKLKSSKFWNWKRGSLKRSLSWMGQCGLMSIQCLWSHHKKKAGHQKAEQQDPMKIWYDRASVHKIQGKTLLKGWPSQHFDIGFCLLNSGKYSSLTQNSAYVP